MQQDTCPLVLELASLVKYFGTFVVTWLTNNSIEGRLNDEIKNLLILVLLGVVDHAPAETVCLLDQIPSDVECSERKEELFHPPHYFQCFWCNISLLVSLWLFKNATVVVLSDWPRTWLPLSVGWNLWKANLTALSFFLLAPETPGCLGFQVSSLVIPPGVSCED